MYRWFISMQITGHIWYAVSDFGKQTFLTGELRFIQILTLP